MIPIADMFIMKSMEIHGISPSFIGPGVHRVPKSSEIRQFFYQWVQWVHILGQFQQFFEVPKTQQKNMVYWDVLLVLSKWMKSAL